MPTKREVPKVKTPEQLAIEAEQDKAAQAAGMQDVPEQVEEVGESDNSLLIHIAKEAGFTFGGRVWFRGQEVEFAVPGEAFRDTFDRFGKSWLVNEEAKKDKEGVWQYPAKPTLKDDFAQMERYGEVVFRQGPWRGKGWDDDHAALQERERNRAAPTLDKRV